MKALHGIAFFVVVIGGLNWGLVGLSSFFGAEWNLVGWLAEPVANIVYVLVGASAVYLFSTHRKDCKCCEAKTEVPQQPQM